MAAGAASATSLESPKIPMMVGFGLEVVCKVFYGVKRIKTRGGFQLFRFYHICSVTGSLQSLAGRIKSSQGYIEF